MVSPDLREPPLEEDGPGTRGPAPGPAPVSARSARRIAVRAFRPRRALPAALVAGVMALIAGVATAELVTSLAGNPLRTPPTEWVAAAVDGARPEEPTTVIASLAVAAIGLLLLLIAFLPGRTGHVVLRTDDPDLVVGLTRAGLGRLLEEAAREVDGVLRTRARVGRRSARVVVHVPERDGAGSEVRGRVAERVLARVTALGSVRPPRVRVRVRRVERGLR